MHHFVKSEISTFSNELNSFLETNIEGATFSINRIEDKIAVCENRENKKLEEYFSDDEVVQAVIGLSDEEKDILLLTILGGYTAEEVGKMYGKTDNNIRVMICNAKKKIKRDYKGGV